jgi:tetratricopeptide (TPR) repeat protein
VKPAGRASRPGSTSRRCAATNSTIVSASGIAARFVLVLLLYATGVLGGAPATRQEEARSLAEQAFAANKQGNQLESGWDAAYDHGIALANQAIALDPDLADAYYALFLNIGRKSERGGVGSQMSNLSQLKSLLDRTLELDPRHAHAWEAKGEMLVRLPRLLGGSTTEGERALRRSAELAPQWPKPLLRLAELDWKNGRTAEARSEALRARDLARAAGDEDYLEQAEGLLKQIGGPSP